MSCCLFWGWLLKKKTAYFFFQAEDGIRALVRSRGLGDVYKRPRQAVDHLKYGLDREGGCILLTGEVGTGMSTLTPSLILI